MYKSFLFYIFLLLQGLFYTLHYVTIQDIKILEQNIIISVNSAADCVLAPMASQSH